MAFPMGMYGNPANYLEKKEFHQFGCGACAFRKKMPDTSVFHCSAKSGLWPDGTQSTCMFFAKKLLKQGANIENPTR